MKQVLSTTTVQSGVTEADDPFRYGWRYVRRIQPDGTEVIDEVPLTLEDLLYPEEGDFVVQEPWHTQDFTYCYSALTAWFTGRSDVVVFIYELASVEKIDWIFVELLSRIQQCEMSARPTSPASSPSRGTGISDARQRRWAVRRRR